MALPFYFSPHVSKTLQLSLSKQRRILYLYGAGAGGHSCSFDFVYRSLLSESLTKMEQYKRQRIFRLDDLQHSGKVKLFNQLERISSAEEARHLASKVVDAAHCAQSIEDCQVILKALNLLIAESDSPSTKFSFGASLMRMYHFLDMPDEAFAAFKNMSLGNVFKDNTCHMLLMDLLYKHGQYSRAVDVYFGMEKFNIDCTTLAFGSLYHINTKESLTKSQSLLNRVTKKDTASSQAVLFASMHSVNQGKPDCALQTLKHCKQDTIAKNIRLISLCKLSRVREVLSILADMDSKSQDITALWSNRIYSDAWEAALTEIEKNGTKQERAKFERLQGKLLHRRMISRQTTSSLLECVILGNFDYKKQRAKRIIQRKPSADPP